MKGAKDMLASFGDISKRLGGLPARRMGVVAAQDYHTLEAVARAAARDIVKPVLYGPKALIAPIWETASDGAALPETIECADVAESVASALQDVRAGTLDCVMKGKLETGPLMKAVVNRDTGIRLSNTLSIVAIMESPYYHKLFGVTDVGLMTYPTLEQKKSILENAVRLFRSLGVEKPKAAVLAAVEKVNEKMPDTLEAHALKEMNLKAELPNCVVEGPISYDLCMDKEAAAIKGYESPVAGDPDILLVPDIVAGNILAKSLTCTGGAKTCGTVLGAMVPIIVTSRSAPAEDKFRSIVLAALAGRQD
jgi:phosphotransacetylase